MRRVVIESPFAASDPEKRQENVDYARACMSDALRRGEAPLASHLLYTQPGILDDTIPEERKKGMDAGFAWMSVAEAVVVYIDLGTSPGMEREIEAAKRFRIPVEFRSLEDN